MACLRSASRPARVRAGRRIARGDLSGQARRLPRPRAAFRYGRTPRIGAGSAVRAHSCTATWVGRPRGTGRSARRSEWVSELRPHRRLSSAPLTCLRSARSPGGASDTGRTLMVCRRHRRRTAGADLPGGKPPACPQAPQPDPAAADAATGRGASWVLRRTGHRRRTRLPPCFFTEGASWYCGAGPAPRPR